MKRILATTDFSEEANKALRYAAALVKKFGAELHVVHVSEIDYAMPGPALLGRNRLADDDEDARELRQQLQALIGESIAAKFHGRTGRAFDQIVRFARELDADLIVMSTHGRTALKRLFLGSNAERVVQHSASPVFIVRAKEHEALLEDQQLHVEKIVVPTDFSTSSQEALRYALEFARPFPARLLLVHAFTIPEFATAEPAGAHILPTLEAAQKAAEDQMRDFVTAFDFGGIQFETRIAMGRAAEVICDYAEKEQADLIITSTHGRSGFMHVLIGSVAEHVVRYARSPVLVVPATGKNSGA
jgi:nucleotide-binding universal stress UspA family protein